jgi:hypothetical protein
LYSFEGYVALGILKREWIRKHKMLVPAVVCLLYIWEPEDKNWKGRENEIATQIDTIKYPFSVIQICAENPFSIHRKSLKSRSNKFLLLLISSQKTSQGLRISELMLVTML